MPDWNILAIFQERGGNKFDFLHEDKHQRYLKADIIVFGGHSQACLKEPKVTILQNLCNISRKN